MASVTRIDCQSEQEEALVIALALRRFIAEHDGRRAALVTPDRTPGAARRGASCGAGASRSTIPPASLCRRRRPAPSCSLLCRRGGERLGAGAAAGAAEASAGRRRASARPACARSRGAGSRGAARPAAGAGLGRAARRRSTARRRAGAARRCSDASRREAGADRWPLDRDDRADGELDRRSCRRSSACARSSPRRRLWPRPTARAACSGCGATKPARRLRISSHDALQSFAGLPAGRGGGFPALLLELLSGVAVRPRFGKHPRLFIWGPLEARLQQADLLVLGGLNEGTWPAESAIDPWLNRPMRQGFGLPRAGAQDRPLPRTISSRRWARREVLLTRAERGRRRADRAVALAAAARCVPELLRPTDCRRMPTRSSAAGARGSIARRQGRARSRGRCRGPARARRPAQLSVTQIETWRRNPYAIYARHILGLQGARSAGPGSRRRRSRHRGA